MSVLIDSVDFYNHIDNFVISPIRYNMDNIGTEGGQPNVHPAFASGQDDFLASLATKGQLRYQSLNQDRNLCANKSKGLMDETYYQALTFCQKSTREDGIDAALRYNSTQLSGLLVPPDVGQTYQIAAQAGDMPFIFHRRPSHLSFNPPIPVI